MDEVILTTCPRDCYDACGVAVVKRDGAIRHVRGDRNHPVSRGRLCVKCATAYNGVVRDPAARLLTPLRRSGPKGSGHFEPISWEEATAEVAARLRPLEPATIINAHYTGTFALLGYHFPQRFFNRLGATEVDPDTICNKAGHVALDYVYGTSLDGFDPRTAGDAACILVWGANPSASAPHQHEHWLTEAPGEVVVVDPIRTPTARAADLHLAPFPGSDAALAFALMHVIRRDGLLDRGLIDRHTVGYAELEPLLDACSPRWGEEITGVPAGLIEQAAHIYGSGPSLLWIGQGFQRQPRGGNAVRSVALLPAISGNIGRRGSGLLYLNGAGNRLLDEDYLAGVELRPTDAPGRSATWTWPGGSRTTTAAERSSAGTSTSPRRTRSRPGCTRRWRARTSSLSSSTCSPPTRPTTPTSSCRRRASSKRTTSSPPTSTSASAPRSRRSGRSGSSLPNSEIFRRLAAAMGFSEPELFESDADAIARVLGPTGVRFEELAARGTVWLDEEPVVQFADRRFPTPSGRIEIASEAAAAAGLPRVPEPYADARPEHGRLRLLSPASPWILNDTFANDAKLTRRIGAAEVAMHPADAAERGLRAGALAVLESSAGSLTLTVAVSDELPRGVIYSPKGRWPKRGPDHANVNVLNPGVASDMGRSRPCTASR